MRRKVSIRLLLVLLILSFMPFCFPIVVDSGVTTPPRNPSILEVETPSSEGDCVFSWTSRWQTNPLPVLNASTIIGDHVVIKNTWNIPVESSRISIFRGFNETMRGFIESHDEWPVNLDDKTKYSWETCEVQAGDEVGLWLNVSQNGDPAIFVYSWFDHDSDNEVDQYEISDSPYLYVDTFGASCIESGSYTSIISESIAIQVLCWSYAYTDNMTYELRVESGFSLELNSDESNPSEIEFDTYDFLGNVTVNLTLSSWSELGIHVVDYVSVSFCNYFTPVILLNEPEMLSDTEYNITWISFDYNADDVNYYSVWLSMDMGQTFYLLSQNLTTTFFVWDSNGFLIGDYKVRVRAHSLDLSHELCGVDNPPSSYWPGDFKDAVTSYFEAGDVHYGLHPDPTPVTVDSPPDITYKLGSTGNRIIWTHSDSYFSSVYYVVTKNGGHYQSGFSLNRRIVVPIDDLPVGVYEFEVTIESDDPDSVLVYVILEPDSVILSGLTMGVSAGSVTIILISGALTVRLMRKMKHNRMVEKESTCVFIDPWAILMSNQEEEVK